MRRALGDQRFMGESRIAVSTTTCRAGARPRRWHCSPLTYCGTYSA